MQVFYELFINGKWVRCTANEFIKSNRYKRKYGFAIGYMEFNIPNAQTYKQKFQEDRYGYTQ